MKWLFENMEARPPVISEPKVDCENCQVKTPLKRAGGYSLKTKCCQFSPFWSAFGVGAWLEAGGTIDSLQSLLNQGMQLTRLGILHSLDHRKDMKSLCHHFQGSGGCGIWANRPPICFSFFCSSQHPDGLLVYGRMEKWLLTTEAHLVCLWFETLKLPSSYWDLWVEYMEQNPDIESLPEELLFENVESAHDLYLRSYRALKSPPFKALINEKTVQWSQGLASDPVLC